jgi:hypothetical protein
MPVDDSYPGLDEPLTGIGDAEPIHFPSPRSAAPRRRGPSQSAVAAAAMVIRDEPPRPATEVTAPATKGSAPSSGSRPSASLNRRRIARFILLLTTDVSVHMLIEDHSRLACVRIRP